jgi:anti-sigma factor RsiW
MREKGDMQHPDEGTIHAWLDGALSGDEAQAFEAHVAECAGCAAAVTEARGLLAASSRILSALDSVPGGVLPAAEPETGTDDRVIPIGRSSLWRSPGLRAAAAIVLVGSVSWLATRSTGKSGERNVASPTELSSVGAIDSTPPASALRVADSISPAGEQSPPPTAPARRAGVASTQRPAATGAAANADQPLLSPAPAPQVAAAPKALPYAMPRLAESGSVGSVGGGAGEGAKMAAQSAPATARANAVLREESRVADAGLGARVEARAKSSAPSAASGSLLQRESPPTVDAAVERLAGCYRLEAAGPDSIVKLVPARVELVANPVPSSTRNSWVLRPAPGAPPFATGARARWSVLGIDSVRLELSDGDASVTARLGVGADSVHGGAEIRSPRVAGGLMIAEMRGLRMRCPSP